MRTFEEISVEWNELKGVFDVYASDRSDSIIGELSTDSDHIYRFWHYGSRVSQGSFSEKALFQLYASLKRLNQIEDERQQACLFG